MYTQAIQLYSLLVLATKKSPQMQPGGRMGSVISARSDLDGKFCRDFHIFRSEWNLRRNPGKVAVVWEPGEPPKFQNGPKKFRFKLGCLPSLKLTVKTPENGWLEDDPFLLGPLAYFRGRAVSFGKGKGQKVGFLWGSVFFLGLTNRRSFSH